MNAIVEPPKLLCVAAPEFARLVERSVKRTGHGGTVHHVSDWQEALRQLRIRKFDAAVIDHEHCRQSGAQVSHQVRAACRNLPLMLAGCGRQPAKVGVTQVDKTSIDEPQLARELLKLCARNEARLQRLLRQGLPQLLPPAEPIEMRSLQAALQVAIVGPDDRPRSALLPAATERVGKEQIQIRCRAADAADIHNGQRLLIGARHQERLRFELFQVASVERQGQESLVEATRRSLQELFPPSLLEPQLHGARIGAQRNSQLLTAWQQLGVLRAQRVDRIAVCPKCGGLPTIRRGCRSCGSPELRVARLVHHYACAHVASAREFQADARGSLTCPKCLASGLVIGADCEHLHGPATCADCDWTDTEADILGRCLRCVYLFPLDQAAQQEVIRYDVDRLDPLDLFPAS